MSKARFRRFKKPITALLVFLFVFSNSNFLWAADGDFITSQLSAGTNLVINPSTSRQLLPSSSQSSGALIHEYPISIPPSRNGLQPDLKLIYNNQAGEEGAEFGFGWNINIPYIQRVNKNGVEKLYNQNYFNSSLDGELVSSGTNTWAAKTENGDFRTYFFSNNQWIVKDKKGNWNLSVNITDTYDYKLQPSKQNYQDNPAFNTLNNAASLSQGAGTISGYGVNIQFNDQQKGGGIK